MQTAKTEKLELLLTARAVSYAAFQNLFDSEPTDELLGLVFSKAVLESLSVFCRTDEDAFTRQLIWFEDFGNRHSGRWSELITPLKREYAKLFIGPASLPAPPWESVYITKQPLLFQSSTLEVRACYRSEGFIPKDYPHSADDYIALELDFMARLSASALERLQDADDAELLRLLSVQQKFLEDHLLKWVPEFAERIGVVRGCVLYPEVVQLVQSFLCSDHALLTELLAEL
jgi:TorA maturation chaperone TorD